MKMCLDENASGARRLDGQRRSWWPEGLAAWRARLERKRMRSSLPASKGRSFGREVEKPRCRIPVGPLLHWRSAAWSLRPDCWSKDERTSFLNAFRSSGAAGLNVREEAPRVSRCRNSRGDRASARCRRRGCRWRSCEREGDRRPRRPRRAASACSERQCLALVIPAGSRRSNGVRYFAARPSGLYGTTWALLQQHKAISL